MGPVKVAITELAALSVTLQLAVPVQAPLQPAKVLLVPGVSLSVIWLFCAKLAEHVVGQLIPAGLLVTVPVPAPAMVTVIAGGGGVIVVVLPPPPLQPASTTVARADSNINQNVYRDLMVVVTPTQSLSFDESECERVVCCHNLRSLRTLGERKWSGASSGSAFSRSIHCGGVALDGLHDHPLNIGSLAGGGNYVERAHFDGLAVTILQVRL